MIKIGLDLHGVIDSKPELFSELTNLLVYSGNEVHVLTGSHETQEIHEELKKYNISYTHFFSVSDHNKKIGTIMWKDKNGNPWMNEDIWNSTKAEYCKQNNIDLHIDDRIQYADKFTTPFARFFSKHVVKKVRETTLNQGENP